MSADEEIYDVIIIGGGSAGLSAAIYAARSKLKTLVLDKGQSSGSLGVAERIENYPGIIEPIQGKKLLAVFRKQAEKFGAVIEETQVFGTNLTAEPKEVTTAEKTYRCKTVIVATGARGRKPTIKGEAEFIGRGVSYCATCDASFFSERAIAVISDTEEALDELGTLAKFASKIYLIMSMKDSPDIKIQNVEVIVNARVREILGDKVVSGIRIVDAKGNERLIAVSGVFIYLHGSMPVIDFLQGAIEAPDACLTVNREDMSVAVPGVFAAGDVTCKKVRQAIIAAAEGALAAVSAEKYVNKKKLESAD